MPRKTFALLTLLLLPAFLLPAQANDGYSWKMAVLKYTKGKMDSLPFSRPLTFVDGDQFQIVLQPVAAGFISILYEDTTGAVTSLYQGAVKAGQVLTLPTEGQNFEVSPPKGSEKIHVLVSSKPLSSLDPLIKGLPKNSRAVLDEVTRIKTALLSIAEAPEKPVPMGGVTRGMPDVKVTEFKGAESYVKTIRFDH